MADEEPEGQPQPPQPPPPPPKNFWDVLWHLIDRPRIIIYAGIVAAIFVCPVEAVALLEKALDGLKPDTYVVDIVLLVVLVASWAISGIWIASLKKELARTSQERNAWQHDKIGDDMESSRED